MIKQGAGPTIYGPAWAGVKQGLWVDRTAPLGVTCVDVVHLDLLLEHLLDLLMCCVCVRNVGLVNAATVAENGWGTPSNSAPKIDRHGYGTELLLDAAQSQHVDRSIHAPPRHLILSPTIVSENASTMHSHFTHEQYE